MDQNLKSLPVHPLERLEVIRPLLGGRVLSYPDWHVMRGGECFSGSMKGVTAYGALRQCLRQLEEEGALRSLSDKTLIDASSGNFATALASVAEFLGVRAELVVSTKAPPATIELIKAYGAKVTIGGETTRECYETVKSRVDTYPDRYLLVGQLENWGNPQSHFEVTGPAILKSVPHIANVFMAMGSGGGVHGVARYLREHRPGARVFVSVGEPGNKIVGTYSNELDFETPFIEQVRREGWLAAEIAVSLDEAVQGMVELRRESALMLGLSSGGILSAYQKARSRGLLAPGETILMSWDNGERWLKSLPS